MSKIARKNNTILHKPVSAKVNTIADADSSFISNHTLYKILLFSGAVILYGWTYQFDYGIDDKFIINPLNNIDNNFHGFISIFKIWFAGADYRPLSFLSFWMERMMFGVSSPGISHAVNVFLFGLILGKIYDFILVSKFYKEEKKLALLALICGILFLAHPNHVSIVANIKARDNLLSMLFGLFATIQLVKYFDENKLFRIVLFLFSITCAYLSKADAYIFIIAPIIIILFFRETNKKKIINFSVITLVLLLNAFIFLEIFKSNLNKEEYIFTMGFDENPLIGNETFLNRLSLSLTSLFYYFKFLIIPTGYYFFYGYNQIPLTPLFSITNITSLFTLLILTFFSIKTFPKNKIYLFSLLFFLISIAYALNIVVNVAGIVMDKYNFIASLGFCLALASIFIDITKYDSHKPLKYFGLIILIFSFISFTIYRTKDWRNSFSLIEKDMPSLTNSVNANRMAAGAYINLALAEEMNPNYNRTYTDSLIEKGDQYAIQGLNVCDKVPDLWELRGLSSFYKKDYNQALQFFLKSKEVDSAYLSSINYIGYTYWALNNTDSASYYFNYVINREPVFNYAANNLINMLLKNNRKTEVDSLIIVFKNRFPEDKWLKEKITAIYGNQ